MNQQQKPQALPRKSNAKLLLFVEIVSIAVGLYMANCLFIKQEYNLQKYIPINLDEQGKPHLIFYSLFLFGVLQFIIAAVIIQFRVLLLRGDPVNNQDPLIIRTLNRALQNSIEWGIMFYPAFTYFVLYKATQDQWGLCKNLAITFVLGRAIHTCGYLLSLIGASTGRAAGVVISMTCVVGCIGLNFGVDTFQILKYVSI